MVPGESAQGTSRHVKVSRDEPRQSTGGKLETQCTSNRAKQVEKKKKKAGILVLEGHLLRLVDQSHLSHQWKPKLQELAFVESSGSEWCTIL